MGHFSRLVDMKDKHILGGVVNLFPEHLDDPQNTLSLRGERVMEGLL